MSAIEVACPSCGATLKIPPEHIGKKGKCQACGEVIIIDDALLAGETVSADDVMSWLSEAPAGDANQRGPAKVGKPAGRSPAPAQAKPAVAEGDSQDQRKFDVSLDHVDQMGAFFHFNADLLNSEKFRSSFPQRCATCGARESLSVHLIDWPAKRPSRSGSGKTNYDQPCVFELDKFHGIAGKELLAVLGRVNLLPEPFCLPFPYYICRSCSPVGAIVTDVRPAADGEGQVCELGIASLEEAYWFAGAACGSDSDIPKRLLDMARHDKSRTWKMLPLAVRNRIARWFERSKDEVFVAYIPDAEFTAAEAGMAGVVVTDKRLVYRKSLSKVEMPFDRPITIESQGPAERMQVSIIPDGGKPAKLLATKAQVDQLAKLLKRYFRARQRP